MKAVSNSPISHYHPLNGSQRAFNVEWYAVRTRRTSSSFLVQIHTQNRTQLYVKSQNRSKFYQIKSLYSILFRIFLESFQFLYVLVESHLVKMGAYTKLHTIQVIPITSLHYSSCKRIVVGNQPHSQQRMNHVCSSLKGLDVNQCLGSVYLDYQPITKGIVFIIEKRFCQNEIISLL